MNYEKINEEDLYKQQFPIEILEKYIHKLNKKRVINTQKLTADFCVKYLLDNNIDSGSEDSYIFDEAYILNSQFHITEKEWNQAVQKYKK
jgi:hypothetical protein